MANEGPLEYNDWVNFKAPANNTRMPATGTGPPATDEWYSFGPDTDRNVFFNYAGTSNYGTLYTTQTTAASAGLTGHNNWYLKQTGNGNLNTWVNYWFTDNTYAYSATRSQIRMYFKFSKWGVVVSTKGFYSGYCNNGASIGDAVLYARPYYASAGIGIDENGSLFAETDSNFVNGTKLNPTPPAFIPLDVWFRIEGSTYSNTQMRYTLWKGANVEGTTNPDWEWIVTSTQGTAAWFGWAAFQSPLSYVVSQTTPTTSYEGARIGIADIGIEYSSTEYFTGNFGAYGSLGVPRSMSGYSPFRR